jgi:hypothetical protein
MNKAPFTQAKTFDHDDVQMEFTDTLCHVDVFVDLGTAVVLFAAMIAVVFALVAARDNWSAWITWAILELWGL